MAKPVRPADHLTDLELRFDVVIFSMTPWRNRKELFEGIIEFHTSSIRDSAEFDKAESELEKTLVSFQNDQNFSNMKKNKAKHISYKQINLLCATLQIENEDFLNIDIAALVNALADSADEFQWARADAEDVLKRIAEEYLQDPSLDPRPGFLPTVFAGYQPTLFEKTNHSLTKVGLIGLLPKHRTCMRKIISNFLPFRQLGRTQFSIKRLRVAASSNVYKLETSNGNFLVKIVRRLDETTLKEVQRREIFFADARIDGQSIFSDSECLRPIPLSEDGATYAVLSSYYSMELGLSDRDHFVTVQSFAENRSMYGAQSIPDGHFTEQAAEAYLSSLAKQLARIHSTAKRLPFEKESESANKSLGFIDSSVEEFVDAYGIIFSKDHEFSDIWNNPDNKRVIRKAAIDYDKWNSKNSLNEFAVMYDLHPFNAFFDVAAKKCTLIFDYEGMSTQWSEEDALAFSTHRFVREYIRNANVKRDTSAIPSIQRIVKVMADAYHHEGGNISPSYVEKIGCLIRITNIGKFLNNVHHLIRGKDIMNRRAAVHDAEARKFLLYLRESELFDALSE